MVSIMVGVAMVNSTWRARTLDKHRAEEEVRCKLRRLET